MIDVKQRHTVKLRKSPNDTTMEIGTNPGDDHSICWSGQSITLTSIEHFWHLQATSDNHHHAFHCRANESLRSAIYER